MTVESLANGIMILGASLTLVALISGGLTATQFRWLGPDRDNPPTGRREFLVDLCKRLGIWLGIIGSGIVVLSLIISTLDRPQ